MSQYLNQKWAVECGTNVRCGERLIATTACYSSSRERDAVDAENAAHAKAISALPDLYAACEAARPLLQLAAANVPDRITAGRFQQAIDGLDAALAKARGGAA